MSFVKLGWRIHLPFHHRSDNSLMFEGREHVMPMAMDVSLKSDFNDDRFRHSQKTLMFWEVGERTSSRYPNLFGIAKTSICKAKNQAATMGPASVVLLHISPCSL